MKICGGKSIDPILQMQYHRCVHVGEFFGADYKEIIVSVF